MENPLNFDIALVVSSSPKAYGLLRAKRAGLRTRLTPLCDASPNLQNPSKVSKKIDWDALDLELRTGGITHIFLAGFMKVIPAQFVKAWTGRIINLHPSLLPSYPGLHSIERAMNDGVPIGITIHEVVAEVDAGKILLQRRTFGPLDDCAPGNRLSQSSDYDASAASRSLYELPIRGYSPYDSANEIETRVHIDEQRAVKEAILKWKSSPKS